MEFFYLRPRDIATSYPGVVAKHLAEHGIEAAGARAILATRIHACRI